MPKMNSPKSLDKFSPMPNTSALAAKGFAKPTIASGNPNPSPEVVMMDEIQNRIAPYYGSKSDTAGRYPKPGIYVSPLAP
jgi:hypothetical protein